MEPPQARPRPRAKSSLTREQAIAARQLELEQNRLFEAKAAAQEKTMPIVQEETMNSLKDWGLKVGSAATHGAQIGGATAFVNTLTDSVIRMVDDESVIGMVLNTEFGRKFLNVFLPIFFGGLAVLTPNMFPSFLPAELVQKVSLLAIEGTMASIVGPLIEQGAAALKRAITAAIKGGIPLDGLSPEHMATANGWVSEEDQRLREESIARTAAENAVKAMMAAQQTPAATS